MSYDSDNMCKGKVELSSKNVREPGNSSFQTIMNEILPVFFAKLL